MKFIKIVLWFQMLACLFLTLMTYTATTDADAHITINSAYLSELKSKLESPPSSAEGKTLGLTHLEFAKLNSAISKSEARITYYFLITSAIGSIVTLLLLVLLRRYEAKNRAMH